MISVKKSIKYKKKINHQKFDKMIYRLTNKVGIAYKNIYKKIKIDLKMF